MKKNSRLMLLCLFVVLSLSHIQAQTYAMLEKGSPLLKNANAVVRKDSAFFEIKSINKATCYYKYAVTILNEKARFNGFFGVPYDDFTELKKVSIRIYDKNGVLTKTVKASEIADRSVLAYADDVSEARLKSYEPSEVNYPYTVEYEYTSVLKHLFHQNDWYFQSGDRKSVVNSIFVMKVPEGFKFHHKQINTSIVPSVSKEPGFETYTWSLNNLEAIESEPYGLDYHKSHKCLLIASDQFEFGGVVGNSSSWSSFGKWNYEINKGRDQLPLATINHIKDLTSKAGTAEEKIDIVYKYVQGKTRYESVQLGIGGWQTFPAEYVDKYGVGDCKALTNYTQALLRTIGIPAYACLVNANTWGENIETDFVSQQFNHVVLCAPIEKDTIWLECTSTSLPTGFVSDFTDNRNALLISSQGGVLVNTPSYSQKDNTVRRSLDVRLTQQNGKVTISSLYTGLMAKERISIHSLSPDKQSKWVTENVQIHHSTLNVNSLQIKRAKVPEVKEELQLEIENIMIKNKEGYQCSPLLYDGLLDVPEPMEVRTQPVVIKKSYQTSDTTRYHFPTNAKIEVLPDLKMTSRFGSYSMEVKVAEGLLTWVRTFTFNEGIYPNESYPELLKFLKTASKGDRTKAVVVF